MDPTPWVLGAARRAARRPGAGPARPGAVAAAYSRAPRCCSGRASRSPPCSSALGAGLSLATVARLEHAVAPLALVVTAVVAVRLGAAQRPSGRYVAARPSPAPPRAARPLVTQRRGRLAVLETEQPLAYCVPALRTSRVVVSAGRARPARAGRARRRARPRARAPAGAARPGARGVLGAAPGLPALGVVALPRCGEVRMLVEVLADRVAARDAGARALGRALVGLAGAPCSRPPGSRPRGRPASWSTGSTSCARRPRPAPGRARHPRRGRRRRTAHRVRRRSLARRSSLALGFDTALAPAQPAEGAAG